MLKITILGKEGFNEETQEFLSVSDDIVLELEHSLLSVSKWESKHQVPFLIPGKKNPDEIYDYLKAMIVTPDVNPDVLDNCSQKTLTEIQKYIDSNQSATTFGTIPERRGQDEVITSELIYFWMTNFNIPFECERWHLNRLFSLIKIANIKTNTPGKKMSRNEISQRNRDLNDERRLKLGTSG